MRLFVMCHEKLLSKKTTYKSAFTLVEMAIVLVIVGLLVGGVLVGKDLIRQAQLRQIVKDKETIQTSIYAFRNKYNGMPGDHPKAYDFFGAGCGTNTSTMSTGCNGDGNEEVDFLAGENVKVWEHLTLAKMFPGSFNGSGTTGASILMGGATVVLGTSSNLPLSKIRGMYWNLTDVTVALPGDGNAAINLPRRGGLYLEIGGLYDGYSYPVTGAQSTLTNEEAFIVDRKVDDGRARLGAVRGGSSFSGCNDVGTDYYYLTTIPPSPPYNGQPTRRHDTRHCMLIFILGK
jgi:prepilin-type N-terminal cleavage/methylation domain-containing protein